MTVDDSHHEGGAYESGDEYGLRAIGKTHASAPEHVKILAAGGPAANTLRMALWYHYQWSIAETEEKRARMKAEEEFYWEQYRGCVQK